MKLAEYKEKYTERNRTYRQKTVTEDELKRRQELNRIRVQKVRLDFLVIELCKFKRKFLLILGFGLLVTLQMTLKFIQESLHFFSRIF